MITRHFSIFELEPAAQLLRSDALVAFPTETVYGLGANAMSSLAVAKIFEAKGRPSDNPLIVHIASIDQLNDVCRLVSDLALQLMDRFWPGPLTIVLPKRQSVPDLVTAGLDSVAVRLPDHALARELIRLAGVPLAAPSANRSGRPSATTWQAVSEDLDGRIAGIVCGEQTSYGLESTVLDATIDPPLVLRPGGISLEQLQCVSPDVRPYQTTPSAGEAGVTRNSPGLRHKHYQPRAKVRLLSADAAKDEIANSLPEGSTAHYIGIHPPLSAARFAAIRVCSDPREYGAVLFDFFRRADVAKAEFVYCEAVEEIGIGVALMDRIRRASQ